LQAISRPTIAIQWHLDSDASVIPRSVSPERIRQNIDVLDLQLMPEDIACICEPDQPKPHGAHPDTWGV
jgi:2,5-diketo-D-gluconate reductase A